MQTIHFYANSGEDFGTPLAGGVDMSDVTVKYFRLKYTYENPETSETKVDYNLHHSHGHLRKYLLTAKYGQNESVTFPVVINVYARSGSAPYWHDVVDSSILNHVWQQCAY